jgi:hypothetical protein
VTAACAHSRRKSRTIVTQLACFAPLCAPHLHARKTAVLFAMSSVMQVLAPCHAYLTNWEVLSLLQRRREVAKASKAAATAAITAAGGDPATAGIYGPRAKEIRWIEGRVRDFTRARSYRHFVTAEWRRAARDRILIPVVWSAGERAAQRWCSACHAALRAHALPLSAADQIHGHHSRGQPQQRHRGRGSGGFG